MVSLIQNVWRWIIGSKGVTKWKVGARKQLWRNWKRRPGVFLQAPNEKHEQHQLSVSGTRFEQGTFAVQVRSVAAQGSLNFWSILQDSLDRKPPNNRDPAYRVTHNTKHPTCIRKPALGPAHPSVQRISGLYPGGKAAGAWRYPLTPI